MARERRKVRNTRQREEQILGAALVVFSEKGFSAATVPEIAEKAGLAVGSIYNYFPNKRELFVAVIRYYIINAPLLELIDALPAGDFSSIFGQIIRNRFSLIERFEVSRIPFLMSEVLRDPELKRLWYEEMLKPFFLKMEGIYEKLSETGEYRVGDPVVTVRIVGGLILGFLMFRIMEGEKSPLNNMTVESITASLSDFLLYGITGKAGTENSRRFEE